MENNRKLFDHNVCTNHVVHTKDIIMSNWVQVVKVKIHAFSFS